MLHILTRLSMKRARLDQWEKKKKKKKQLQETYNNVKLMHIDSKMGLFKLWDTTKDEQKPQFCFEDTDFAYIGCHDVTVTEASFIIFVIN